MARIRILPDRVANQIAAGEVVERPAAVVKELVENALDAGAARIAVEFRGGGRSLIRVEDDGRGMAREDAQLAFARHATSKIAEAADLDRLATFGFRGEALPSIASVSHCTLWTREAGAEAGTEVLVDGGKRIHVRDCGRPVGTCVEVARLFHPVPARRKFLKTDRTEAAHIIACVRLYALACPQVAFALIEDGKTVFRSPAGLALVERVAEIFGRDLADALVPVEATGAGLGLRGLIARPGAGRATRHETIAFVNSRPVESRALTYALVEAYRDWLPANRFPPAVLFLACDPAAVDVNVHPSKREVRFRDEPGVRAFVIGAVARRLAEFAAAAAPGPIRPAALEEPPAWPGAVDTGSGGVGPVAAEPAPLRNAAGPEGPAWRLIGLAHGNFALFEAPAGIVVLDRRAALERVWFDRLQAQDRSSPAPSQRLLLPLPLELDPIGSALLNDQREVLGRHGFAWAEFGRHFFRLEALPAWMEPSDAAPFLRKLLAALRDGRSGGRESEPAREHLARLAAAGAARLAAASGEGELMLLVAHLFATRAPLASPSGRATFVEFSRAELERRFDK